MRPRWYYRSSSSSYPPFDDRCLLVSIRVHRETNVTKEPRPKPNITRVLAPSTRSKEFILQQAVLPLGIEKNGGVGTVLLDGIADLQVRIMR
jgi:hypothetical protein